MANDQLKLCSPAKKTLDEINLSYVYVQNKTCLEMYLFVYAFVCFIFLHEESASFFPILMEMWGSN